MQRQWHDTGGGGYYCNNYSSSSTTKRELIDINEVVPELEESTSPKDDDTNGLYTRVTATGLATTTTPNATWKASKKLVEIETARSKASEDGEKTTVALIRMMRRER